MYLYQIFPKIIIFLLLIILISSKKNIREDYTDVGYESLIKWGLENSLQLSNNIKLTKYKGEKQYISKDNISKGELIMDIPPEITLTIDRALTIFNSDNLTTKFNNYIKEDIKSNKTLDDLSHIYQSFISYLLYISSKTNTSMVNKFYEYYKPLYYIFEDDISHIPSLFNNEQINIFLNTTSFGSFFELMNIYLMGEVNLFEKKIFKENIDLEQYFRYRFLIVQKSYNISNTTTVAPFIDFIKRDFNTPNCKLVVKNGHIKIKAIRNIEKGELITIKPRKISNQYSFFFYGKIYKELIDYMPSFIIPIITPNLFNDEGIILDIDENDDENKMDLAWPNFYDVILPTYKEVAQSLKKDDSDYACYGFILKYLYQIKNNYDLIHYDDIEEAFDNDIDSDNVISIIESEKNFLKIKIKDLINIMEKKSKKIKILNNQKGENYDEL